jgi:hypothetical protein
MASGELEARLGSCFTASLSLREQDADTTFIATE